MQAICDSAGHLPLSIVSGEASVVSAGVQGKARISERIDRLAAQLGLRFPTELVDALSGPPPSVLASLLCGLEPFDDKRPSVIWAVSAMRVSSRTRPVPGNLIPFMAVDDRSFACAVCQELGASEPVDFGVVVRWHLDAIPPRAQRQELDRSVASYVASVAEELSVRHVGLRKMEAIAQEYESTHSRGERLPKPYELRPVRLAVQNVILGLAAFRYDSRIDALAVPAWQTCEAPHVAAHEGARGLLGMTLAEAYKLGTTMEIDFSEHPEARVPASLRRLARARGVVLGGGANTHGASVTPPEARALMLAVTPMPDDLKARVDAAVESGLSSAERLCFVLLTGIWSAIELDYLLAVTARADSLLKGGANPLNSPVRQAELEVCRSALLVGAFYRRLLQLDGSDVTQVNIFEDLRRPIRWRVLGDSAAVVFDGVPAGPLPWARGTAASVAQAGKSLVVLSRTRPTSQDFTVLSDVARTCQVQGVIIAAADAPASERLEHPLLRALDDTVALDAEVERRLLRSRVARA